MVAPADLRVWKMAIISRVVKGASVSTLAPAASKARAAACTAAAVCGSTGSPQPASNCSPSRRPFKSSSRLVQSMRCAGRLMLSRQSGRASASIISAASVTVRVMGPATRPA